MNRPFDLDQLVELCQRTHEETRRYAAYAVDRSLVVRNWLFGWYIVEFEGGASTRRELYGKELVDRLSARLTASGVKGCSRTNLRKFREFYQVFADIRQTASVESGQPSEIQHTPPVESLARNPIHTAASITALADRFTLGWSHYVILLSINHADARRFYEIEAANNRWSVRELKRQLASSLYERLALSRDEEEVRRLAREGQVVEKASDLIKDPVVLEFLGLQERPAYSEIELETGDHRPAPAIPAGTGQGIPVRGPPEALQLR